MGRHQVGWMLRRGMIAALILAAIGCGPSQEEFDAERARANDLQRQLRETQAQRNAFEERLRGMAAQNDEMTGRLGAMGQNVQALEGSRRDLQRALEELRARERQAQARLATFRSLIERFRSMIESGRLRVRIVRNRMVVELPEGVLFDSGKAELKREGKTTLNEVATVLKDIPNRQFQIAGHTDNLPIRTARFPSNWELSTARAVNVARYVMEQGVEAAKLSAAGYADTQPVADNADPAGRQQNRRIEIALVPNLDELPDLSELENVPAPEANPAAATPPTTGAGAAARPAPATRANEESPARPAGGAAPAGAAPHTAPTKRAPTP